MKRKGKRNLKRIVALLFAILTIVPTLLSYPVVSEANFEGYKTRCLYESPTGDNSKEPGEGGSSEGVTGDWTQEGTKAYQTAKDIWDYWKNKGFNGAAIAGVHGNVAHEGGFDIPDRAQGHFGGDSKSSGLSEGVEPIGGGGGHYQFTPYTKYAPMGDPKWLDTKAQSDFVWSSEVKNAGWLEEYKNSKTPEAASQMWFDKYERGASYDPEKDKSARKAYELFGGANIESGSAIDDAEETAKEGEESSAVANGFPLCDPADSNAGDSDSEIVNVAKALLGYFSYQQVHGEHLIGSVENPDRNGITDCSGYVWLVLARAGYNVPADMGWYTMSMENDAKGEQTYLQEISASEAGPGDVVIVNTGDGGGSNGHTAILTEKWKADEADAANTTMIIQMGGDPSASGVNESSFVGGFLSLVNGTYGPHSLVFARPVKK